jgi:hypothetical protein
MQKGNHFFTGSQQFKPKELLIKQREQQSSIFSPVMPTHTDY